MLDFIRIACAVPAVRVGDTVKNTEDICKWLDEAEREGCDLVLFPELAVTGYTCGDLFLQETLLGGAEKALRVIADHTAKYPGLTAIVGAPLQLGVSLFNCGVVISGGYIRGIVPKTFLCNEMDEGRWFVPASVLKVTSVNMGYEIPPMTPFVGRNFNVTRAGIHADGLLKDEEIYNIFNTKKILGRGASVLISKTSGASGIAYWINENYRLEGNEQIDKRDPLVVALKEWVDREYEDGRQTALSNSELEEKIEELSDGKFKRL